MQMCVLGSGSGGNCTAVRVDGHALLIDAGFGPRTVARRLHGTGLSVDDVSAILVTHLDGDHFTPTWIPAAIKRNIAVHIHKRHVYHLYQSDPHGARELHQRGLLVEFADQPFELTSQRRAFAAVRTSLAAHDRSGVVTFRVESDAGTLVFATDLGRVTKPLVEWMANADILALESNYDAAMQLASPRPMLLKKRIMGGRGHLSNAEAFNAIRKAVAISHTPPCHIVLLHLSRQCNSPQVVCDTYADHPDLVERLCITSQLTPTPWLRVSRNDTPLAGEQLAMFS